MTERVENARASILHQRPYRETSLLLEVFSRDYGRIGLVANGARRPKSRLRALLQPLREVILSWQIRGELGTLRMAEACSREPVLAGDALYAGFYMNELLMRLCVRADPHPELYDTYRVALTRLAELQPPGLVLRLFEKDLLESIGYGLQLQLETQSGQPVNPREQYLFDVQQGPQIAADKGENRTVSGEALLALHSGDLTDPAHRRAAKQILQQAIARLLDNKPLRTVQTLKQMQASRGGA